MSKQKCEEIFQRSLAKVAKESIGYHQAAQTYMDGFKDRVQEITDSLNSAMLKGDVFETTKQAHAWENMWIKSIEHAKVTTEPDTPDKIKGLLEKAKEQVSKYIDVEVVNISVEIGSDYLPKHYVNFWGIKGRIFRVKL